MQWQTKVKGVGSCSVCAKAIASVSVRSLCKSRETWAMAEYKPNAAMAMAKALTGSRNGSEVG